MELVLFGEFGSHYSMELGYSVISPTFCKLSDLGFSCTESKKISIRPPMPDSVPYDAQVSERTLSIERDNTAKTLGLADISEGYVYDYRYRSPIDFTGIAIKFFLRDDAYDAIVNYIGRAKTPEKLGDKGWNGGVIFSIPSPDFKFPMPRGSENPFIGSKGVGKLREIQKFQFNRIEIQALRDEDGNRIGKERVINGVNVDRLEPALNLNDGTAKLKTTLIRK